MWSSRLPSLRSLRYLEAAVRHESFTRAAGELHVTPSAISHQIRSLEEALGTPLFLRGPRGAHPTARAIRLAAVVHRALGELAEAIDAPGAADAPLQAREITLGIGPSLANQWLVPRLIRFREANPGWILRPSVGLAFHDLTQVDAALRYGLGRYPSLGCLPLPRERLVLVCAPDLLDQQPLEEAPILQAYSPTSPRPDSPERLWARAHGPSLRGVVETFDRQSLALAAAVAGQGVAIVPWQMARDAVRSGLLRRPVPLEIPDPLSYYLVWDRDGAPTEVVDRLHGWLSAQMIA